MNTQIAGLPVVNLPFENLCNTYFTVKEMSPAVVDGSLQIINGKGISRSWGTPSINSQVTQLAENIVMVSVRGWHKHSVGYQTGTFYFVFENGVWTRRTANYKAVKSALANQVSQ